MWRCLWLIWHLCARNVSLHTQIFTRHLRLPQAPVCFMTQPPKISEKFAIVRTCLEFCRRNDFQGVLSCLDDRFVRESVLFDAPNQCITKETFAKYFGGFTLGEVGPKILVSSTSLTYVDWSSYTRLCVSWRIIQEKLSRSLESPRKRPLWPPLMFESIYLTYIKSHWGSFTNIERNFRFS